jgi:hypothetical protein
MMPENSRTTLTRHAAYDEVSGEGTAPLAAIWDAIQAIPVARPEPATVLPPIYTTPSPTPTYRIPPEIGEQLLVSLRADDGVQVVDRRGPPSVTPDPARINHRAPRYDVAVRAAVDVPRAVYTDYSPRAVHVLAAAMAEAFGPVGGIILTRDRRQSEGVARWFRVYTVGHGVLTDDGMQSNPVHSRSPGAWTILRAGHPAWVNGTIPDPPVIIATDVVAACRPRVRERLFACPDQRVIGIAPSDNIFPWAALYTIYAYFGPSTHVVVPA